MLPGQKSALAFLWGRAVELKTEMHHAHEERYKTFKKGRVKQSHLLYFLPRYPPVHVGVHPELKRIRF